MNIFSSKKTKPKSKVELLDKCIVINQNYYHSNPPLILAVRKETYVVLNPACKQSIYEVHQSAVKVPIDQEFSMTFLSKAIMKELDKILTKKEMKELLDAVVLQ